METQWSSRLDDYAAEWLATLEDIASNVRLEDPSTHMTEFEQNLLEDLRRLKRVR